MWVFWGDFSANGNRSPHGLFKDLDLSRTFHYSKCCVEKCPWRSQGLSPMGYKQQDLRRELNAAWGSGGFTPAGLGQLSSLSFSVCSSPLFYNSESLDLPMFDFSLILTFFLSHPIYMFLSLPFSLYFGLSLYVLPFFTEQTGYGNSVPDFIFGQLCRHNLPLSPRFLHSLLYFLFLFVNQTLLSSWPFTAACQQAPALHTESFF